MYAGSVVYYETDREWDGEPQPKQFPQGVALDGQTEDCGQVGGRCPEDGSVEYECGQALNFSIADPYNYRPDYLGRVRAPEATFRTRARGDLDCDGVLACHRNGAIDPNTGDVTGAKVVQSESE